MNWRLNYSILVVDKQIGSIMSQCLILGSTDINGDVLLLNPDKDASLGDKVS